MRVPPPAAAVPSRQVAAVLPAVLLGALLSLGSTAVERSGLPAAAERAAAEVSADDLRAHVRFLSSDELMGRGVGHPGNEIASLYLATTLERIGLPAAGPDYYQPFDLHTMRLGADSVLRLHASVAGADVVVQYEPGEDFQPLRPSASRRVSAGLVFAGYGISAPDLRYDDYEGLDVSGRIVMVLDQLPPAIRRGGTTAGAWAGPASLGRKIEAARTRGAVGLLIVRSRMPDLARTWPEEPSVRATAYRLARTSEADLLPVAAISTRVADEVLAARPPPAGAPESVEQAARLIERALKPEPRAGVLRGPASFAVPAPTATLAVHLERRTVGSRNVLAWLEGRDPDLRHETLVIGAHFDHDGIDADNRIYAGADDNGSGTAAVLALAQAFARTAAAGERPRRSIVFALWNAEEKGLLGARHYLSGPWPAGADLVAKINLDMIGRDEDVPDPSSPRFRGLERTTAAENRNLVHLLGYSYSPDLARAVQEENDAVGLTVRMAYDSNGQNLIRRSDHWPFLERRIPAIFFTTGLHPDYHTPEDGLAKLNFEKMERIVRLAYRVAWRVADDRRRPDFVDP